MQHSVGFYALVIFLLVISVVLWWTSNHHLPPEEPGEALESAAQRRQRAAMREARRIDMLTERGVACFVLGAVILLLIFNIR